MRSIQTWNVCADLHFVMLVEADLCLEFPSGEFQGRLESSDKALEAINIFTRACGPTEV